MEDVTIVIQGKISQESYDFYIKNYTNCKVIISTWVNCDNNFTNLPENFIVLLSQVPSESGDQNLNYQLVSTLNALQCVRTKYCIKIRGDEYWSNIKSILNNIKKDPNKIHTSPVFFRAWQFAEYHISDHLIAGTTENLLLMFSQTKYNFDRGLLNTSKWIIDGKFWKWGHVHAPEERLTKSYLNAKYPQTYERVDGRLLMKESFNILDIEVLKPYKIVANIYKAHWYDDFIPENNFSISNVDRLFSDDPYKLEK